MTDETTPDDKSSADRGEERSDGKESRSWRRHGETPDGAPNPIEGSERPPRRPRGQPSDAPRRDDGDRPPRREWSDRPPRRDGGGDRPPRRDGGGDRSPRRDGGGDRPPRREWSDRPPRRDGGGDRPPRREWSDRPPRRDGGGDRPPRRDGGGDRPPRREWSDRPPRRDGGGDRPPRREWSDRPPRRDGGGDRPPRRDGGGDRPPRREWSDRPPRRDGGGDRPPRGEWSDRPPRRDGGGDRPPRREWSDRPPRRDGGGDRPPSRDGGGDRPPRRDEDQRPERVREAPAPAFRPTDNSRGVAAEVLCQLDENRATLTADLFAQADREAGLDARARRFAQELVYGVLRRRLTLDCLITAWSHEPISQIEPDCLQVIRVGLYQLLFMDGVPPFAAIDESVGLLSRRHPGVRALANGILRSVSREMNKVSIEEDRGGASPRRRLMTSDERVVFFSRDVFADPADNDALHLAQLHSHPPFLVERWLARHDRALVEEVLASGNRKPRLSIRYNRLKTDRDGLVQRLQTEGLASRIGLLPESIIVDSPPAELVASSAFQEGLFYVQDEAAMKVAPALDPKPGERILDLCAAPGGKATHLAELTAGAAKILAVDASARRLERITENCERLGIQSIEQLQYDPLANKESQAPPEGLFDAAIIDVPCSNTGVMARRPEVRWRVSLDAIRNLADRGRQILAATVPLVRPGGRIIYSTCSLEHEENQEVVDRSMVGNPRLQLRRQEETLPSMGGPDGGFFAVFDVHG